MCPEGCDQQERLTEQAVKLAGMGFQIIFEAIRRSNNNIVQFLGMIYYIFDEVGS